MSDRSHMIYINPQATLANKAGMHGAGFATDLMMVAWWPARQAFVWEYAALFERLTKAIPARGCTVEKMRELRSEAQTSLTLLPDSRWATSRECFSLTNGNPGRES